MRIQAIDSDAESDTAEYAAARRRKILYLAFDIFSGAISLLDLTTDLVILAAWYNQNRMVFFWISCCILFMAQCSYLTLFHYFHGIHHSQTFTSMILCLLFTIPVAPFIAFIFHFVAEQNSKLRGFVDEYLPFLEISWHNEHSYLYEPKSNKERLERVAFKHAGFLLEAAVEAFPQSFV